MSTVYLVRHGQASFEADDYDQLSELGARQCGQLGRHWVALGRPMPRVFSGGMRRQQQSAAAFARVLGEGPGTAPVVEPLPGIEEYDHLALLAGFARATGEDYDATALRRDRRAFHRLLARALDAWPAGGVPDMLPYARFRQRCEAAVGAALASIGRGSVAVVFGSAGSLSAAVQSILGAEDRALLRLTLTFHNTGGIKLLSNGTRTAMESFNVIPHLEQPGLSGLITQR